MATLSLTTATRAATITWGAATAVSTTTGNSSDVSLDGTLHHAVAGEFGGGSVSDHTVNGVLFTGVGGGNGGGLTYGMAVTLATLHTMLYSVKLTSVLVVDLRSQSRSVTSRLLAGWPCLMDRITNSNFGMLMIIPLVAP